MISTNLTKKHANSARHEYYGKYLETIVDHFHCTAEKLRKLLPVNAKRAGWPKLVIITATLHRNYHDYADREKFNKTVKIIAGLHQDVWAMDLVQIWDKNNNNLYAKCEQRLTYEGLGAFWKGVDRTLVFCNKKVNREDNRSDRDQIKNDDRANPHQNASNERPTEKIFWN